MGRRSGARAHRAGGRSRARGDVVLVAEDGTSGPAPVELAGLGARVQARSAVLDGEIVVVDEAGRLDRDELARRLAGRAGPAAVLPRVRPAPPRRPVPAESRPRPAPPAAAPGAPPGRRGRRRAGDGRARAGRCSRPSRPRACTGSGLASAPARTCPGVRSRLWRSVAVDGRRSSAGGSVATLAERCRGHRRVGGSVESASSRCSGACPWSSSRRAVADSGGRARLGRYAGGRMIAPTIWRGAGPLAVQEHAGGVHADGDDARRSGSSR